MNDRVLALSVDHLSTFAPATVSTVFADLKRYAVKFDDEKQGGPLCAMRLL